MTGPGDQLGDRLRTWRRKRGMTQEQLAYAADVSVGLIGKLEQGERRSARDATARAPHVG